MNGQIAGANACFLQYFPASNSVLLVADAGSGTAGSAVIGSNATLNNTQCTFNAAGSSVTASGNNLTVSLALVFKPPFNGLQNIYMGVVNNPVTNFFSGWQRKGTFNAQAAVPNSVSVASNPTASSFPQFSFVYTDPSGYADVQWVDILFN